MFYCISKYGEEINYDEYSSIGNDKVYILDTDDWSVEYVFVKDIAVSNLAIANLNIYEADYALAETDFIACLNNYKESGFDVPLKEFNSISDYTLSIKDTFLHIELKEIDRYKTRILCINGKKTFLVDGTVEINYIFLFGDYIVIRFTVWTGNRSIHYEWCSISVDTAGNVSYWTRDGKVISKVGTKIDMISEV